MVSKGFRIPAIVHLEDQDGPIISFACDECGLCFWDHVNNSYTTMVICQTPDNLLWNLKHTYSQVGEEHYAP